MDKLRYFLEDLIWRIQYFLEGCNLVYIRRVVTWEELWFDEQQEEEYETGRIFQKRP